MQKIILALLLLPFSAVMYGADSAAKAAAPVTLVLFSGQACPSCVRMSSFLESIKAKYPTLVIEKHDVFESEESGELFAEMAEKYGVPARGIPTIFLGDKSFAGYSPERAKELEQHIIFCVENGCVSPHDKVKGDNGAKARDGQKVSSNSEQRAQPSAATADVQDMGMSRMMMAWILFALLLVLFISATRYHRNRRRQRDENNRF